MEQEPCRAFQKRHLVPLQDFRALQCNNHASEKSHRAMNPM
jgi:hypothetical protein